MDRMKPNFGGSVSLKEEIIKALLLVKSVNNAMNSNFAQFKQDIFH